ALGVRRSVGDLLSRELDIPELQELDTSALSTSGLRPLRSSPGFVMGLGSVLTTDNPRERIGLTLHRFFERALADITDCEISLADTSSFDHHHHNTQIDQSPLTPASPYPHLSPEFPPQLYSRRDSKLSKDILQRIKEVLQSKMDCGSDILLSSIRESVCYVKVRSSDRFLLVFLPAYPVKANQTAPLTLVNDGSEKARLGQKMTDDDKAKVRYLSVTVMDCKRPSARTSSSEWKSNTFSFDDGFYNPTSTISELRQDPPLSWKLMVPHDAGGPGDEFPDGTILIQGGSGASSVADPANDSHAHGDDEKGGWMLSVSNSKKSRWEASGDPKAGPSDYSFNFLHNVTAAYSAALCRTMYSTLLQFVGIDGGDLDRALLPCVETSIDIDLTDYLNIMTLKRKALGRRDLRRDSRAVQYLFRSVIRRLFEPVSGLIGETRNLYFFRGSKKMERIGNNESQDDSSESRVNELIRILEWSETPLFIKTDCSFKKANLGQSESTYLPILDLPASYRFSGELALAFSDAPNAQPDSSDSEIDDLYSLDFTPHIIGTSLSPLESVDGTVATLHIKCLTLPRNSDSKDE
ncbi:hypothetical protein HDV05_000727, partial [Chytridiales sp. JEL 0842]